MQNSEIVGIIAGFGTTFAALPDLIKMLRRHSSAGMNPSMPAIMALFQVVWIYYGVLLNARPIIVWNIVAVVINSLSVAVYTIYSRRERSSAGP